MAYGSFQAGVRIAAVTASLHNSHRAELHLQPAPQAHSRQRWILNPLREVRDQSRILMNTSRVHYHGAMTGTPR